MSTAQEPETATSIATRAFLFFSIGPVQPFIEKARTVRDLTTGSYLLAWLTAKAAQPILNRQGCELVTPDKALVLNAKSPTMPNRFIAEVPADQADLLAKECKQSCMDEWERICQKVYDKISPEIDRILKARKCDDSNWSVLWDAQLGLNGLPCPLDFHSHAVPIPENDVEAKELKTAWDTYYRLTWSIDAVRKQTRHIHRYSATAAMGSDFVPAKCTMFSAYEQMGPPKTEASRLFWEWMAGIPTREEKQQKIRPPRPIEIRASRVRERERLSALGLVKRFAWFAHLEHQRKSNPDVNRDLSFSDTATVAAASWFRAADAGGILIDPSEELIVDGETVPWNGQWLHWQLPDSDENERPCPNHVFQRILATREQHRKIPKVPTYYAILMLDGDKISKFGQQLRGRDQQLEYSKTIAGFAQKVQSIVEDEHQGELIYAGGDDVLALLPVSTALDCGSTLWKTFLSEWTTPYWTECIRNTEGGFELTCSAGLAVVHYKQDLRFALDAARKAEKLAKGWRTSKNALAITVCRRSGQHSTAVTPWSFVVDNISLWVKQFLKSNETGSDAWTYQLARELPTLEGLDSVEAISGEISRLVHRSKVAMDHKAVASAFEEYYKFKNEPEAHPKDAGFRAKSADAQKKHILKHTIRDFVTLSQSASFLARGRDE